MKITCTLQMFIAEMGNHYVTKDKFSYEALRILFYWYDGLEFSTGEEIEFDPICINEEWTEYKTLREACENYGVEFEFGKEDEAFKRLNEILIVPFKETSDQTYLILEERGEKRRKSKN